MAHVHVILVFSTADQERVFFVYPKATYCLLGLLISGHPESSVAAHCDDWMTVPVDVSLLLIQ